MRLKLRIMTAKGDNPEYYNVDDKARINQIITDVVIPKLQKGWTLCGAKKGEKDFIKIADQNDVGDSAKLAKLMDELDRFMLVEGEKLMVAPVQGGGVEL